MKRALSIGGSILAVLMAVGSRQAVFQNTVLAQGRNAGPAPSVRVNPYWPQPLPNHWVLGSVTGVAVDAQDHVWVTHRGADSLEGNEKGMMANPPTSSVCCVAAPFVLQFDSDGKLLSNFGGPGQGYQWPQSPGSLVVADGYGNKRVVVIDGDTGKFKRYWGAYGNKPSDEAAPYRYTPGSVPLQQFRGPVHCADISVDNLVYVCDRTSDRLQVFTREGKFVKEIFVAPDSLGDGSTWDVAFSKDAKQKYLYIADGRNQKLRVFDRESLAELTNFGEGGHYPGQFYSMHSIAVDSKGNLFTTETYQGRRVQKFTFKGLGPVTKKEQGTVWPRTSTD